MLSGIYIIKYWHFLSMHLCTHTSRTHARMHTFAFDLNDLGDLEEKLELVAVYQEAGQNSCS